MGILPDWLALGRRAPFPLARTSAFVTHYEKLPHFRYAMAIKEDVAHLANGARVSYLDTGAPEGSPIYRTFVFIHGAAHNKCA